MTPAEVDTWVRQLADEIAAETSPTQRLALLRRMEASYTQHHDRLRAALAYRLRADGMPVDRIGVALGTQRWKVRTMIREHAASTGQPNLSPVKRTPGRPDGVLQSL